MIPQYIRKYTGSPEVTQALSDTARMITSGTTIQHKVSVKLSKIQVKKKLCYLDLN